MTPQLELQIRHALRRLSIRGWSTYAGWTDMPAWGANALDIVERIRHQCEVGRGDNSGSWRLSDAARREAFSAWPLEDVKQVLMMLPDSDVDRVSQALSTLLGLRPFDPGSATAQQLADLLAARSWLPKTLALPQALSDLSASQLHQASVHDDYRALTKHGVFGRREAIAKIEQHLRDVPNPTVYLTGKGGSGKSTALAMLRLELQRQKDCIVVLLDFDRPELTMKESSALDRELIAELGRAAPQLAAKSASLLNEIREMAADDVRERLRSVPEDQRHLRDVISTSLSMTYSAESTSSSSQSRLFELLEHLTVLPAQRLVLLLDTFERVESAGSSAVYDVSRWLSGLSSLLPSWSIARVLSGRGKAATQIDVSLNVSMDDLSIVDARELLVQQACPPVMAKKLASLLPSRTPLVLLLAADAVRRSGVEGRQKLMEALRAGQIPAWTIEGYLYQRILQHLDDPLARKYAIASVILPELSLDLVLQVLIPVTEPGRAGDSHYAQQVFDALKKVGWLVILTGSGHIRLREELRSTMLKILNGSTFDNRACSKLRRRAITYHLKQETAWDKSMHVYHRLLLGAEKQQKVDKAVLAEVRTYAEYLVDFSDDLPVQVASLLSRQADEAIDLYDAIEVLCDSEWKQLMEGEGQKTGRGQYLVDKVDPVQALQFYNKRPTAALGNPPTFVLQAMCDAAQWDDPDLSVHDVLEELVHTVERSPKVWRETLLRLQWLTRLVLFRHGAEIARGSAPDLEWALGRILERCSLYGVTTQLADTFAMAEAMYGRLFFRKDIYQRVKGHVNRDNQVSADDLRARSPRLSTLRNRGIGGYDNPLVLPWEACIARSDFETALEESHRSIPITDSLAELEFLFDGPLTGYKLLHGAPWAEFQRFIRSLKDYVPLGDWSSNKTVKRGSFSFVYNLDVPIGLWSEFYRPLRQIWMDDLSQNAIKLSTLASTFNHLVPVVPKELSEASFVATVFREPRIWFFVLAQHADRSGKLLELLDAMIEQKLYSGIRLVQARDALRVWQWYFWHRSFIHSDERLT